jgi:hypothetical protein
VHPNPPLQPLCQQLFHDAIVKPAQHACPEGKTRRLPVNDEDRTFVCLDEQEQESTPLDGVFRHASGKTVPSSYKIWTSFVFEDVCVSGGQFEQQLTSHDSF